LNEYPLPQTGSRPFYITPGNNGTLWICETQYNQIVMFDTSTNTFKAYSIPTSDSIPIQTAVDQHGFVWFTESKGEKIGMINPSNGTITEFQPQNETNE